MANTELNHLIIMANQIAANLAPAHASNAAGAVADHINRFWARAMKEQLIAYARNDGADLDAITRDAVNRLN